MKAWISNSLFIATILLVSCGNNDNAKESSTVKTDTSTQVANTTPDNQPKASPVDDVIAHYLHLKNALANDNGNEAGAAAKEMGNALTKVAASTFNADQKKVYDDVKDDIAEHAGHIGSNASNIGHQRKHFDLLSKDVIDFLKATGSSQTLYMDFCPMYNDKKGASWLSETKEIRNPYYGKKMPKCGEIKEEIKAKA